MQAWWALNRGFLHLNEPHISHFENGTAGSFAEHHLFFSQVFANTNFVRTNFHSFDFLSIRFVVRECICDDFLFTEMSTNIHFWNGSHQFLDGMSTSVAFFVSSRTPALLSQVACCFQLLLFTPSLRVGCCGCCCCCCVSQLLFNVTLGAGLAVASLSNITRSPFWEITRSMQFPGTVA